MMAVFPHLQQRAQAELDSVLGPAHFPHIRDRAGLPYTEALVQEVYRWNPVGPLGVPHSVMEDDEYKGYAIPKGATVVANTWCVCIDVDGSNELTSTYMVGQFYMIPSYIPILMCRAQSDTSPRSIQ